MHACARLPSLSWCFCHLQQRLHGMSWQTAVQQNVCMELMWYPKRNNNNRCTLFTYISNTISHTHIYICKWYSNHIQVTTSLYGHITSTFPFCAPSSHSTVSAPPLTISSSCRPSSGWSNARVPLKPTTTEPCAAASCLRSCCNCQK